jgi:pimeloyl-ACP methyl ester carboxylesterase
MTRSPRERIVRFGDRQGLAGILSSPREVGPGTPYVVLVNSGIVHRVGPNRLYVDIARALVVHGYPVLRFDLSGLGDSEAFGGGASLSESAVSDIRAALDFLQTTRASDSFIVGGLCSGANYSMLATFADPRIVGAILIDPAVARTRHSEIVHFGRRLRHAATLGALLTLRHPIWRRSLGRLRSLAIVNAARGQSGQRVEPDGNQHSPQEIRVHLQQVVDRGVQLMLVFTGGVNQNYNYREQLFDLLPGFDFRQQLRLEFIPETDHTISDGESRRRLLRDLGEWIATTFPAARSYRERA